ncbi:MAG: glycosyltransferase family 2 protein [Selenomonadaceae bacterium]|nr:glycosyltransferase family 2 protein [Selenomonadaceae bacterium]
MKAPAVSVIIPMYNAEKYIAECLESVLAQTLQDIEVILVDDCSTDSSVAIAESYLEKFGGRLNIYDNEKNSGAGGTRNNGLLKAAGEYVYFMDADDLILADGLEKVYKIAKYFDVDAVNLTKSYDLNDDGKSLSPVHLWLTRRTNESILENNLEWRVKELVAWHLTSWAPWRRFLRRKFLLENEIFFPENVVISEDRLWTYCVLFQAKKMIHVPLAIMLYRLSDDSMTRKERTPLQDINLGIDAVIEGIEWINDVMDKVPFFEEHPRYRYAVLENAVKVLFELSSKKFEKVSPAEMYLSIKEAFGKNFGEYENVVPVLCTMISNYRKTIEENKALIAELKNKSK